MTEHTPVTLLQQMNIKVPQIIHLYVTCLRGSEGHVMSQHGGSLRCQPQRFSVVPKHGPGRTKHESTTDEFCLNLSIILAAFLKHTSLTIQFAHIKCPIQCWF